MRFHDHLFTQMALVTCPECRQPAQIIDRFAFESNGARLEQTKVRCRSGHWFTLPSDRVA